MACEHCHPGRVDRGFDLPDVRASYWVQSDDPDADGFHALVVIRRVWFGCSCGMGSDYRCEFDVRVGGITRWTGDSEQAAHDQVEVLFPGADLDVEEEPLAWRRGW